MPLEKKVPLEGSLRHAIPGAKKLALDTSEAAHVTVVLRGKDAEGSAPDPNDLAMLKDFAANHGLTVGAPSGRSVPVTGTVQMLSQALGADVSNYEAPGVPGMFRGRTGSLHVPEQLAPNIVAVLGLDTRPVAKPHHRISPHAAPAGALTPLQVAQLYQFPAGDGKGQTIAIIELGGGFRTTDLNTYFNGLKVAHPKVTAVGVDGGKNQPGTDTNADGEVMLDIEVAGAVAPGAHIVVYFAPNTDQGFHDAIAQAAHDKTHKPSVISISWGGPEDSWTPQAREALNLALQDAAALGVTVTVAAGDDGATDGVAAGASGKLHVDFPASSPFALACGGTKLVGSGGKIASEIVWNELAANEGATGGGVSRLFPLPDYQKSAHVPAQPETKFAGRGVPDVAGNADPTTGFTVRVDGKDLVIGGTSAVSPLWAGLVAILNQQLGKPVGFLNPSLYSLTTGLHDITSGNNNGYTAGPAWDACTGLGSPNGAALLKALKAAPVS